MGRGGAEDPSRPRLPPRGFGRFPLLAPLPARVSEGGAGLAPLWRGGKRRAGVAPRPRRQRARLLASAAAPGGSHSRDAASARHWRAAQRLRGHVRWPRPPATMSLTARVSCSMLSCFVSAGPPAWARGPSALLRPQPRPGPALEMLSFSPSPFSRILAGEGVYSFFFLGFALIFGCWGLS